MVKSNIPGFITFHIINEGYREKKKTPSNIKERIIPAGTWCCIINPKGDWAHPLCHVYDQTNWFFAHAGCEAETIWAGPGSTSNLIECWSDDCCGSVGCVESR